MVYNEPRDWLLSPKPFLGNAFLLGQKLTDAENVFIEDLKNNDENGWSLYGLYRVAHAQNNVNLSKTFLMRYKKAFEKSDIQLTVPVF